MSVLQMTGSVSRIAGTSVVAVTGDFANKKHMG
jgi:hypothetical protein